jgi:hypothetical protein
VPKHLLPTRCHSQTIIQICESKWFSPGLPVSAYNLLPLSGFLAADEEEYYALFRLIRLCHCLLLYNINNTACIIESAIHYFSGITHGIKVTPDYCLIFCLICTLNDADNIAAFAFLPVVFALIVITLPV